MSHIVFDPHQAQSQNFKLEGKIVNIRANYLLFPLFFNKVPTMNIHEKI